MRNIKFTHTGHAHAIGNFEAGDVARNLPDDVVWDEIRRRLPDDVARHFVEDARCAVYDDQVAEPAPEAQTGDTKATKAKKGTKA